MEIGRRHDNKHKGASINVQLDGKMHERLITYCRAHGLNKSEAIRRALTMCVPGMCAWPVSRRTVELSVADRAELINILEKGDSPRRVQYAKVLLALDSKNEKYLSVSAVAEAYLVPEGTVFKIKARYCNGGLNAAINAANSRATIRQRSAHEIKLQDSDRVILKDIITKEEPTSRRALYAKALLAMDSRDGEHLSVTEVAKILQVSRSALYRIRELYCEAGLDAAINRKRNDRLKVTKDIEANIVALARTVPPAGCERWSYRLLAKKAVEFGYIESITYTTVAGILKRANIEL